MKKITLGTIPPEAASGATLNESVTAEQRNQTATYTRTTGPQRDGATGAFRPAEYPITRSIQTAQGTTVEITSIRRDC